MSGLGRYIVDAVVLEHRSPTQIAREHGISERWVFKLLKRFREGGYASLEPRSRRPKSCSNQASTGVAAEVVRLRQQLEEAGFDAGPQTILHHLSTSLGQLPSAATVWRILKRQGPITPQPHKRPKASSSASRPSSPTRPGSATPPSGSSPTAALWSPQPRGRPLPALLNSVAYPTVKAADVVEAFLSAGDAYGFPASLLSDNAAASAAAPAAARSPSSSSWEA